MTFTLIEDRTIPEINATARLYVHDRTGARVLSVVNNDENKCFGITFRTPPADSTGVAHIMEHSVLCGSRKYPVKEPFVEILKGSLQTFVNAFTYPDKTCYPLASQNLKDFYNLVDVYLDAVFYPLIPEHTLQQEGWHFELDSPDAPLTYKGVVFNEMKGAYSSPDDLLGDRSRISLFPDNTYGFDSGGDPLHIPDLTYAAFKQFHQTYYHPSNAYIYFYGDDPEEKRLEILESWLKDFDRVEPNSQVPLQPRFASPRSQTVLYDSGDSQDARAYLTLNWMLNEVTDAQTTLELSILSHILLATPASPLRKVLIESGLGEDVTGGFEEQLRQTMFSAGLKGIIPGNLEKVESLILDTLASLASEGLDPQTVAASMNTVEFYLREQNTGRFPRGLALMLGVLTSWLHDGNPLEALAFEAPLALLKSRLHEPGYFESLITKHLLDNPHRTTVHLLPDPLEGSRREAMENDRLADIRAAMTPQEIQQVIDQAAALKLRQETPDTPEALDTIPGLTLDDIDPLVRTVPVEDLDSAGTRVLYHDIFTNGIVYLDLGFDLHALPGNLLPYAGLLGRLFLEMGTASDDFVTLTQRIGRDTGGIHSASLNSNIRTENRSATWFFLRGKAVTSQAAALLEILKDILLTARLDNRERLRQIVLERKASLEAGLIPGGSGVVNQRLRAHFTEADWLSEQMHGVTHLFFLRELAEKIEKDWPAVLNDLEALRSIIVNGQSMLANVTLDAAGWGKFRPQLDEFLHRLPGQSPAPDAAWPFNRAESHPNEGLTIPTQVNYVGKGASLYHLGYTTHGSILVINNYLQTTWLWEKVRVQGGAYGGQSSFDLHSGVFTFLSYRDPNLLASLDIFDATADFLSTLDISQAELTRAIIGTIGDLDAYLLPDARGWTSMSRTLLGYSDAQRQKIRDEVIHTSPDDFRAFGKTLVRMASEGQVVVLGSANAIEKANAERSGFLHVQKVL